MTLHNAPSVVYPLGHSRFHGYLLIGLWSGGTLLTMVWLYGSHAAGWPLRLAFSAVTFAGLVAYAAWKNSPVGNLAWDGQFWNWEGPGYQSSVAEQKVSAVFDFQSCLLLRLENPAHAQLWLWAERDVCPDRWLDLRRAVFSPHKAARRAWQDDLKALEPMHAVAVSGNDLPIDVLQKP